MSVQVNDFRGNLSKLFFIIQLFALSGFDQNILLNCLGRVGLFFKCQAQPQFQFSLAEMDFILNFLSQPPTHPPSRIVVNNPRLIKLNNIWCNDDINLMFPIIFYHIQAFHFSLNSISCTRFKALQISFLFLWSRTRDMIISTTAIVTVAMGR